MELDPPEKSQGWVTAIDASTGEVKWKHRSSRPMVAAVTTTRGNLLLTGELNGDFLVLDARTGSGSAAPGLNGGGIVTCKQGQYIIASEVIEFLGNNYPRLRQLWCSFSRKRTE
jgi:outer membrane protein assembly factor BamB